MLRGGRRTRITAGALAVCGLALLVSACASTEARPNPDDVTCVFDIDTGALVKQLPPGSGKYQYDPNRQRVISLPASNRFYLVSPDRSIADPGAPEFVEAFTDNGGPKVLIEGQLRFKFNQAKACQWFQNHGRRNSDQNWDLGFNERGRADTGWARYLNENFGTSLQKIGNQMVSGVTPQQLNFNGALGNGRLAYDVVEETAGTLFSEKITELLGDDYFCGVAYNPAQPDVCPAITFDVAKISLADEELANSYQQLERQRITNENNRLAAEQRQVERENAILEAEAGAELERREKAVQTAAAKEEAAAELELLQLELERARIQAQITAAPCVELQKLGVDCALYVGRLERAVSRPDRARLGRAADGRCLARHRRERERSGRGSSRRHGSLVGQPARWRALAHHVRKGALAATLALTLGGAVATAVVAVDNGRIESASRKAQARVTFWEIVADRSPPTLGSGSQKLAFTLRDQLGPADPTATALPAAIVDFVAVPGTFAGVRGEIGTDPFDGSLNGSSCAECGHLDAQTLDRLLLIKQGRFEQAIAGDVAASQRERRGYVFLAYLAVIWQPLVAAVTHGLVRRDRKAHASPLAWRMDGTPADDARRSVRRWSPLYALTVGRILAARAEDRFLDTANLDEAEYRRYLGGLSKLDGLLRVATPEQRELLGPERARLADALARLERQAEVVHAELARPTRELEALRTEHADTSSRAVFDADLAELRSLADDAETAATAFEAGIDEAFRRW